QAQQREHRAGDQPEVEKDREDQDADDDDEPSHQAMTLAALVGTGTESSSSSITDPVVTLRSRLSGLRISRCPRTAGISRLTSSGVMNDCPRIAASACADRYSASEARGLPPSRMSGCSRLRRISSTMYRLTFSSTRTDLTACWHCTISSAETTGWRSSIGC